MIVALGSVRGSPGVSAWSMLLAAAWPSGSGLGRVVLEADVDGGVAGARYAVGVEPGAQVLVSDLRHVGDPSVSLETAGRRLGDNVWLVPGQESGEAARRLWSAERAAVSVASALAGDASRVWLCDVGRVTPGSPTAPLLGEASLTLLFCRDAAADVVQVPSRVEALQQLTAEVAVVVVGSPGYDRGELGSFFGCSQVWVVPAVADLVELSRQVWTAGQSRRLRAARLSPAWRAALELGAEVNRTVTGLGSGRFAL